jgi:hypothetical protein
MFRLSAFGTVSLEHYNQIDNSGSGVTPVAYQALPEGGALDLFGARQTRPGTVERVKSLRLRGSDEADLEDLYLELLGLAGKRDKLYRKNAAGDLEWQYARLVEVTAVYSYELAQFRVVHDVDLRFVTQNETWRGDAAAWYLNQAYQLNDGLAFNSGISWELTSSPKVVTISEGESTDKGRAPVRAIKVTVMAGNAAMTAFSAVRTSGETLTWAGTLDAGKALVIDCGLMQVTNDGADAYDELTFSATADMAAWFTLQPGDNEITLTWTGGGTGATISFEFYEAWY